MPHALIGTYTEPLGHTRGGGPGVQRVELDAAGRIAPVGDAVPIRNASFICVNAAGERAYVISEVVDHGASPETDTAPDGCITTLRLDANAGTATVLATRSSAGPGPAWCGLSPDGARLLTANYVAGSAVVYPLNTDGTPGAPLAVLPHTGHGPHPTRQEAPHAHAAVPSPDGRWMHVTDLGTDQIAGYRLTPGGATAEPSAGATLPPGSGPRHLAWAPGGAHTYAALELASAVCVLGYDADTGALTPRQTLPAHADASITPDPDTNHPSEITVHPGGRFLVIANRGLDALTTFAIDPDHGTLIPLHDTPVGRTPRHFAFTADGTQLLLAEQDAHRLTSHAFDADTSRLTPTGHAWDVPSPCAVCFLPG